jgi:hypothetical protein
VPADKRGRLVFTFRYGIVDQENLELFNTTWVKQFDNKPEIKEKGIGGTEEEAGRSTWTHGRTVIETSSFKILQSLNHTGTFHTNTHKREGVGGGEVTYIHTHRLKGQRCQPEGLHPVLPEGT